MKKLLKENIVKKFVAGKYKQQLITYIELFMFRNEARGGSWDSLLDETNKYVLTKDIENNPSKYQIGENFLYEGKDALQKRGRIVSIDEPVEREDKIEMDVLELPSFYSWVKENESVKMYLGKGFLITEPKYFYDDLNPENRRRNLSVIGSYTKNFKGFIVFSEDVKGNDTYGVHKLNIEIINNRSCFYTKESMISQKIKAGALECWTNDIGSGNYMLCSISDY